MRFSWVNNGREFVPQATVRDFINLSEMEPPKTRALEARAMAEMMSRILQRTDPAVTVEVVLDNVLMVDLDATFWGLFRRSVEAAAPGGEAAPTPTGTGATEEPQT